jgi:hypothetical protein
MPPLSVRRHLDSSIRSDAALCLWRCQIIFNFGFLAFLENYLSSLLTLHFYFLAGLCLKKPTMCLVHLMVQATIGESSCNHTCFCFSKYSYNLLRLVRIYSQKIQTKMMRSIVNNWIRWYVNELDNKMTCRLCDDSFIKKNVKILSHLGYGNRNGQRDTGVKLCKNIESIEFAMFLVTPTWLYLPKM